MQSYLLSIVTDVNVFVGIEGKPTEVTVSLYILSIGNFQVRDMVRMGHVRKAMFYSAIAHNKETYHYTLRIQATLM